jgi:predicted MPP superfamily phosphohydrolase
MIVSGHTHGGQIRLPWLGIVPPLPDKLGKKYDRGIFPVHNKTILIISQGLGEHGPRARLFCPPEVMMIEVRG